MTDEQLVALAKNGDKEAMNAIIERYRFYAKKISRSYFIVGGDSEDLMQEAMIGIYNAVTDYNGESSFKSFACMCIKRRLISAVRKSCTFKNKSFNNCVPLFNSDNGANVLEVELSGDVITPESQIENEETEKELLSSIKKHLSAFEYEVLTLYLQGYSYQEIADKMDIKVKAADNALARIRAKLSKLLIR